jgi:nicotinamidase-related amidase
LILQGTEGAAIHDTVKPHDTDIIVVKRRVGAFGTTDLQAVLSGLGVKHLVLTGYSTSGVILSTVRWAADADYRMTVVDDMCGDGDAEVHSVLMAKVFPRQADVVQAAMLLSL